MSILGFIVIDGNKPLIDTYGNAVLFKKHEDTRPHTLVSGKVYRVVRAKIPRKKRQVRDDSLRQGAEDR